MTETLAGRIHQLQARAVLLAARDCQGLGIYESDVLEAVNPDVIRALAVEVEALEEALNAHNVMHVKLRANLAATTEALREIGNQKGDVFAIRGEFPERTIPVVELSNTVLRCAKIAGDALAKLTETKPPDAGDTVLLRQPPEEV